MARVCLAFVLAACFTGTLAAQSNPWPTINEPLSPTSATPGSSTLSLTVNGSGFVSGAVVYWDQIALSTTVVNPHQLTATVPSSNLASAHTSTISVSLPGGPKSNAVSFHVAIPVSALNVSASLNSSTIRPARGLMTADVNHDGKADLIVLGNSSNTCGTEFGAIAILLGSGHGSFSVKTTLCSYGNVPFAGVAGDFNSDGNIDLAVISHNGTQTCGAAGCAAFTTYLGDGRGGFVQKDYHFIDGDFYAIGLGDFDGDGKLDLVVSFQIDSGFGGKTLSIFPGNGDGSFSFNTTGLTGINTSFASNSLAVGDFDNDGIVDIASAGPGGQYLGTQLGPLTIFTDGAPAPVQPDAGNLGADSVVTADVNGDGKLDLILSNGSPTPYTVLTGNGDGTFSILPQNQLNIPSGSTLIGVSDLNDDGHLDLVFSEPPSTITALFGEGNGTFDYGFSNSVPSAQYGLGTLADFNGDGRTDIAIINLPLPLYPTNSFYVLEQTLAPRGISVTLSSNPNPTWVDVPSIATTTVSATPYFPTGSVTFEQGGVVLGTSPLVNGRASIEILEPKGGTFQVTSRYSGDSNYPSRSSNAIKQVVDRYISDMVFGPAPEATAQGQPVSFFIHVHCTGPQDPMGRVKFTGNNVVLGSAIVINDLATLTSSTLPLGQYSVTANYSGDRMCDVSTETSLWQLDIY